MITEVLPVMERNWLSLFKKKSGRTPPTDKNSHSVSLTPILIILCNLNLGILSWLNCLGFPIKLLHAFVSLRVHVTYSLYLIILYLIVLLILGEGYKLWISTIQFSQSSWYFPFSPVCIINEAVAYFKVGSTVSYSDIHRPSFFDWTRVFTVL